MDWRAMGLGIIDVAAAGGTRITWQDLLALLLLYLLLRVLVLAVVFLVYGPLWLRARAVGLRLSIFPLANMRFKGVRPEVIVDGLIAARCAGVEVTRAELETHYLAHEDVPTLIRALVMARRGGLEIPPRALGAHQLSGGDIEKVVSALVAARRGGISITFEGTCAADLAGRDTLEEVSKALGTTGLREGGLGQVFVEDSVGGKDASDIAVGTSPVHEPPIGAAILVEGTVRKVKISWLNPRESVSPLVGCCLVPLLLLLVPLGGGAITMAVDCLRDGSVGMLVFLVIFVALCMFAGLTVILSIVRRVAPPTLGTLELDSEHMSHRAGSRPGLSTSWTGLFKSEGRATASRAEIDAVILRWSGTHKCLTVDTGAKRIEIGEFLRDPEKEWLAMVLRKWHQGG